MNVPSRVLFAEISGPARWLCSSVRRLIMTIALLAVVFFAGVVPALAINAPTITHVAGVAVAPETTMYSNVADFQVKGNAEAGTTITLYRNTTVASTTITSGLGVWTMNLTGQPQGSFSFKATAFDTVFTSEPSVIVPVIIDWTPPVLSIGYGSSGCRSNQPYQCNNIGYIQAGVSDIHSKVDFSSAGILVDYVDVPSTGNPDDYVVTNWTPLPGYIDNNGTNEVSFYSNTGFGTINQNYRKIRITANISDWAGNQTTLVSTFYNNARANQLPAVVQKIWDPGHNIFTGTGETAANTPDVDGWVSYYPI